ARERGQRLGAHRDSRVGSTTVPREHAYARPLREPADDGAARVRREVRPPRPFGPLEPEQDVKTPTLREVDEDDLAAPSSARACPNRSCESRRERGGPRTTTRPHDRNRPSIHAPILAVRERGGTRPGVRLWNTRASGPGVRLGACGRERARHARARTPPCPNHGAAPRS